MAPRVPASIVSPAWVAEHLLVPELVVLDASWYLPVARRDARVEYQAGHLPGAVYIDLDAISDPAGDLPHTLPDVAFFGRVVGGLGISNASSVVIYDGSGNNLSAARVWWMFHGFGHTTVAVLDGGLAAWRRAGLPLETGDVRRLPQRYQAAGPIAGVTDLSAVRAALASGSAQVVDLRSAGRFAGRDPEPRPGLPSGHMAGAISLPYTDLVDGEGFALPDKVLRARLVKAGIDLARPIIATCGSGTSACNLLLGLERLGVSGAALYDGSWTEWVTRGMPIATGGTAA
ncbi:MAG: sulfurtransferase [Gemmatimonadota bacterium]|nr:sulfurtransferase [Gemmatimonadota bacterium]